MSTADRTSTHAAARTARRATARRTTAWTLVLLLTALAGAWQVAGHVSDPVPQGGSWNDPAFVQAVETVPTREARWVVWDAPRGGEVIMVMHNPRPWPLTVSGADPTSMTTTRFAASFPEDHGGMRGRSAYTFVDSLVVPGGADFMLSVRISTVCVAQGAGAAAGVDSVPVRTRALGVTDTSTVRLATTFMAGWTQDHEPDPSCAG